MRYFQRRCCQPKWNRTLEWPAPHQTAREKELKLVRQKEKGTGRVRLQRAMDQWHLKWSQTPVRKMLLKPWVAWCLLAYQRAMDWALCLKRIYDGENFGIRCDKVPWQGAMYKYIPTISFKPSQLTLRCKLDEHFRFAAVVFCQQLVDLVHLRRIVLLIKIQENCAVV